MLSLQRIIHLNPYRLSTAATVSRQIRLLFCSLKKMNHSQNPNSTPSGYSSVNAQKSFSNGSPGAKITNEMESQSNYEVNFPSLSSSKGKNLNKREKRSGSGLEQKQEDVSFSEFEGTPNVASVQEERSLLYGNRTRIDSGLQPSLGTVNLSENEGNMNVSSLLEEHSLPSQFGKKKILRRKSDGHPNVERFNICLPRFRDVESREVLRPGMVLLKHYISIREQINIVKTCNSLGGGSGGFYRPGYKDGAKLRLHMMCLGKNWDPQTRRYDKLHPVDNCEAPDIPLEFRLLVERAIKDAHYLIEKDSDVSNPEYILPSMSPDICILNFYSVHGRLGLHQDRDESTESLQKGLPVVSISIGDSAEFLYGDGREPQQAGRVLLESGDVLIFGGESRMVFHGVPSIVPSSAPEPLIARTGLRQGRLNLTFRQF